jgi:hypothetical protein
MSHRGLQVKKKIRKRRIPYAESICCGYSVCLWFKNLKTTEITETAGKIILPFPFTGGGVPGGARLCLACREWRFLTDPEAGGHGQTSCKYLCPFHQHSCH